MNTKNQPASTGASRSGGCLLLLLLLLSCVGMSTAEPDPAGYQALSDKAKTFYEAGQFDSCSVYRERALQVAKATKGVGDSTLVWLELDLAYSYYPMAKWDKAEGLAEHALALARARYPENDTMIAKCLGALGVVRWGADDFDGAEKLLLEGIEKMTRFYGPSHPELAKLQHNLALVYWNQERLAEALELTGRAERAWDSAGSPQFATMIGSSLNLQAILCSRLGQFDRSEKLYKRALEIRERVRGPNHTDVASSLNGLANLYMELGEFAKAEPAIERAFAIYKERFGAAHPRTLTAMLNLARLRRLKGEYASAENLMLAAISATENSAKPSTRLLALFYGSLGNVYLDEDRYDDASQAFQRSCDLFKKLSGDQELLVALQMCNLAITYHHQGRLDEARELLMGSLGRYQSVWGEDKVPLRAANCLAALASVETSLGNFSEAERLYRRILSADSTGTGPSREITMLAMSGLARLSAARGDKDTALRYFEQFFLTRHQFVRLAFSSSSEAQKIRWLRLYPMIDANLINYAVSQHDERLSRLALEVVLNGKAVVTDAVISENRGAFRSSDEAIQKLLDARSELCTRIANMVLAQEAAPSEITFKEKLESLLARRDTLESEVSRLSSDYVPDKAAEHVTVEQVARALPSGTALCEFLVYQSFDIGSSDAYAKERGVPHYARLTLDRVGEVGVTDLGPAQEIDSLVLQARRLLYSSAAEVYSPAAAGAEARLNEITSRLTERLMGSIASDGESPQTLLIAPDGMLNLIPFEILPLSDGRYMVEKYRIAYLTCGRDLVDSIPSTDRSDRVLLVADPDFDGRPSAAIDSSLGPGASLVEMRVPEATDRGSSATDCPGAAFSPLPQTREEIAGIADVVASDGSMQVNEVTGARATEAYLKNLKTVPRILHLATHGFFCSATDTLAGQAGALLRSGLALAGANHRFAATSTGPTGGDDGNLTALEVSSLNLYGNELTVLSACESGVGEVLGGEGVFGLRRAFRNAGSETLIMSLWKVPNRATSRLMAGFYRRYLGGESRVDALRNSMLDLMANLQAMQGHRHPLMWGGFVMVGRPD